MRPLFIIKLSEWVPSRLCIEHIFKKLGYELTLGKRPTQENRIHMLDHEKHNLTNDPQEQKKLYKEWIASIGADKNHTSNSELG